MADKQEKFANLGYAGSARFCMDPTIGDLTPQQRNALHIFKHKMLAAAFELYNAIPPKTADPILSKIFKELPDQIDPTLG
jgi:hypothetical protein